MNIESVKGRRRDDTLHIRHIDWLISEHDRLAGEVERLTKERDFHMQNEVDADQECINLQQELTAAQQSAKEQFVAGCERAIEIIKALDTNHDAESYNCGYVFASIAIARIREAAKEGSK